MSVGVGDAPPTSRCPATGGQRRTRWPTTPASRWCSSSTRATTRRCAPSSSTATTTGSTQFDDARRPGAGHLGAGRRQPRARSPPSTASRSRCWPTPTRRSPRAYGTLGPARLPAAQRVHRRRRRRDPLRPPGDRRADLPPGQRAGRRRSQGPAALSRRRESRPMPVARACGSASGYRCSYLCRVADRIDPVLGIDPGLTRCGYAVRRRRAARNASRPSPLGVIRTPPDRSAAAAAGRAARRAGRADRRVPARRGRRRAGVLPGQRAHGDERRAGQRAGPGRGRGRRLRGRPVHAEPGEGRGRRLGRRRQGAGAEDGADPPRPRHAAQPADAADAAALALCHLAIGADASAASPPPHAEAGDDRLAARHGARARRRRRGAGRGRRRRLPRHGHAAHAGRARADDARRSSTSTTTSARTPRRSTASCPRRAGDVRGADRHPRRRAGAGAGHPRHPLAGGARRRRRRRRRRRSPLVPGRRQEDRRAPAGRAEDPPRRCRCSTRSPAAGDRNGAASAVGDVREALAGLGYGPDEIREALRELPDRRRRRRRCCATRSSCWGPAVRDEFLDPAAAGDDRGRRSRPGCGPRRLDEFVGQRELKEHLAIVLEAARRRGQAADHLLFAGPPGLGKTTPGRHRRQPRWACTCTSRRARRSSGPATSPRSSPSSTRATCCSSTRSTACRAPSRRSSTRRWRTSSSTSSSARARRRRRIRLDAAAVHARRRHHPHRA